MSRVTPGRLIVAVLLLLSLAASGAAQSTATAPGGTATASLATHPLFVGVALADAQRTAIVAIRARSAAQAQPARDSLRLAMRALGEATAAQNAAALTVARTRIATARARLDALLAAERRAMRRVLTPEQQSVYDANLAAESERAARAAKANTP